MPKVVVIVEGGVVREVISDDPEVEVLVLDRDEGGVSEEMLLQNVLGDTAALDALEQGRVKVDVLRTHQAYQDVYRERRKQRN